MELAGREAMKLRGPHVPISMNLMYGEFPDFRVFVNIRGRQFLLFWFIVIYPGKGYKQMIFPKP